MELTPGVPDDVVASLMYIGRVAVAIINGPIGYVETGWGIEMLLAIHFALTCTLLCFHQVTSGHCFVQSSVMMSPEGTGNIQPTSISWTV